MSVFSSQQNERVVPAPERRPSPPAFSSAPPQPTPAPRAPEAASSKASVLGKTLVFRGELSAEEDLVLQGRVEGSIHHTRSLTVGVDGVVVGDIHAASITVEGSVEGDMHGSASVSIGATAKVRGNIVAPRVGITEGAQFNGSVDMSSAASVRHADSPAPRTQADSSEFTLNEQTVNHMLEQP
jgi:cytoskeletal protein CcmA (bactofilin family)